MEKVTKISFMRKLKAFDSSMILSVSNKSLEDVKSSLNDVNEITFNRSASVSGSNVVFTFLQNNEIVESYLSLSGVDVYFYNDFYIVIDEYETVKYILVYKISGVKTLDFGELKQKQLQKEEEEKILKEKEAINLKERELKQYFSSNIWNASKIENLTPLQIGRIKKSLDKQYRYDGIIMTVKEKIESLQLVEKYITNKMCNFNRKHYNNLNMREQNKYEAKLKASKLYHYSFLKNDSKSSYEIPKIIYDILDTKEV